MLDDLKRMFVGRPLATTQMEEQRLPKTIALAVFSSDALSSTAYATEEILFVVAVGGSSLALGLSKLVPIAVVVAALLAIVIISYRQVIFAYPSGGGAYVVSKENIGEMASLVAGASLMVDYVLTVAVSISAGVAAIVSIPAFSGLARRTASQLGRRADPADHAAEHARDQGVGHASSRSPPTSTWSCFGALIIYGLVRSFFGDIAPVPFDPKPFDGALARSAARSAIFLLLKGFSSGAVALTGVEAISNGVPSFRRPESKNAATTLVWMGVLLGALFFGISVLAHRLQPYPSHEHDGDRAARPRRCSATGPLFVFLQFATAAILVLAANTAYNGFPSLSSIIAKDGYLPRQLANRGDRLVFSNGIIVLAGAAALLARRVRRHHQRADPALRGRRVHVVHAVAVRAWCATTCGCDEQGWRRSVVLNAVGAVATLVVLLIVAITKFTTGAWVPIVVIPLIVLLFKGIKRHYARSWPSTRACRRRLPAAPAAPHRGRARRARSTPGVLEALAYGRSIAPDHLVAMTVVARRRGRRADREAWARARDRRAARDRARRRPATFTAATLALHRRARSAAGRTRS